MKNLNLKLTFPVSIMAAFSVKVEDEEVVTKNLNLTLSFLVSITDAISEKVEVEDG